MLKYLKSPVMKPNVSNGVIIFYLALSLATATLFVNSCANMVKADPEPVAATAAHSTDPDAVRPGS